MQKGVAIQIGSYRLRDKTTRQFLPCQAIMKTATLKVAQTLTERVAILLVDCYQEYEKSNSAAKNGN